MLLRHVFKRKMLGHDPGHHLAEPFCLFVKPPLHAHALRGWELTIYPRSILPWAALLEVKSCSFLGSKRPKMQNLTVAQAGLLFVITSFAECCAKLPQLWHLSVSLCFDRSVL